MVIKVLKSSYLTLVEKRKKGKFRPSSIVQKCISVDRIKQCARRSIFGRVCASQDVIILKSQFFCIRICNNV